MREAVIVSVARTPIAKAFRGAFNDTEAPVLSGHAARHAIARAGIDAAEIEDVVLGCAAQQGTEAEVLDRQQKSKAAQGARYVDDVTDVKIDGDKAAATVGYHFEHAADDKLKVPMTFVRENGDWTVCSRGPV